MESASFKVPFALSNISLAGLKRKWNLFRKTDLWFWVIEHSETVFSYQHCCRFRILLNVCFVGSKDNQDTSCSYQWAGVSHWTEMWAGVRVTGLKCGVMLQSLDWNVGWYYSHWTEMWARVTVTGLKCGLVLQSLDWNVGWCYSRWTEMWAGVTVAGLKCGLVLRSLDWNVGWCYIHWTEMWAGVKVAGLKCGLVLRSLDWNVGWCYGRWTEMWAGVTATRLKYGLVLHSLDWNAGMKAGGCRCTVERDVTICLLPVSLANQFQFAEVVIYGSSSQLTALPSVSNIIGCILAL